MDSAVNLRLKNIYSICALKQRRNYMLCVDNLDTGEKVFL